MSSSQGQVKFLVDKRQQNILKADKSEVNVLLLSDSIAQTGKVISLEFLFDSNSMEKALLLIWDIVVIKYKIYYDLLKRVKYAIILHLG